MATARHNGGEGREGVDIGMLAVAALAAVAAAVVTSKLWPGGTLVSTALTPVIVALVKEWLRKPAERISAVSAKAPQAAARVVAPARGASGRGQAPRREPRAAPAVHAGAPTVGTRGGERAVVPPAGSPAAGTPPEETFVEAAPGASSRYRLYRRRSPHWRLAAITGLLAFVVAALLITLPELVLGGSVAGKGSTTVFGGGSERSAHDKGAGQKKSDEQSGDGRSTSDGQQKNQSQDSKAKPGSKSTQPSTGSPSQPSRQQAPATPGAAPAGAPSAPGASSPGQGSPGSNAPPPSGGP